MVTTSLPSSSLVSIAGRAGHKFTPQVMLQGFACHARGVELCETSPTHIRARVRSKRLHDVDLRALGGRLVVACTCAARSLGLDVCKHAWAALLEVDRRGGLEELHEQTGVLPVDAAPLAEDAATRASSKRSPAKEVATKKRPAKTPAAKTPPKKPAAKVPVRGQPRRLPREGAERTLRRNAT